MSSVLKALTYSQQGFAGQLSSYGAEAQSMDRIGGACGIWSKEPVIVANGALDLAIYMFDGRPQLLVV